MTFEKIDQYLKENLTFNSVDLFYAFCNAKGIDNPEEVETDEEYTALEDEFCKKVTYDFLSRLVDATTQDVNERFHGAF